MTVGQELEEITELKLFHNHMTMEMVLPFFDMKSQSFKRLVNSFRFERFKEVAKSDLDGLIFTYIWEPDQERDCNFITDVVDIFKRENAKICYVELEAGAEERLIRNKSPNRLKHKPSKKNFEVSEKELLETDRKHILNSNDHEFKDRNHFKIDHTDLSAETVAKMNKEQFCL